VRYNFRVAEELAWFVVVAVMTTVMQMLIDFNPNQITDWRLWAVGVGAAAVRSAAGAILAFIGKRSFGPPDPPPAVH
jgi:hypothetical protein